MPEIRLFGFSGDWEQHKFKNDIISIQTGTNLLGTETNNGTPLIKMGNIQRGYFSFDKLEHLDINEVVDDTHLIYNGDFFLNTRNTLELVGKGATWFLEGGKYAFNNNIARCTFKNIDTYFFNYLYNTEELIRQIKARAVGTTSVAAVYPKDLNSIEYSVPKIEEQIKVGTFFKQLDDTITLHQQELDTLKQTKQGFLQKMFPKEGESVPEIRFPGFTGDWKQNKLGEFGKATGGTSIESEFVDKGKYKVINIGSYSENSIYTDQGIRAMETEKTKRRILNKGDLTMILNDKTSSGRIIGRVLLIDEDNSYVYNQRTERIEPDKINYDSQFLYQLLNAESIRSKIIRLAQGNTQIYVNWSNISELKYLVPNKDEQSKIGRFFKQLDDTITQHEKELETLQQTKKAFLQKMFV